MIRCARSFTSMSCAVRRHGSVSKGVCRSIARPFSATEGRLPLQVHSSCRRRPSCCCANEPPGPEAVTGIARSKRDSGPQVDLKTHSRRRWSNLNGELRHEPGSLIGAATLVAGTTIGVHPVFRIQHACCMFAQYSPGKVQPAPFQPRPEYKIC